MAYSMDGSNPFSQLFSSSEALRQATEIAQVQKLNVSDVLTRIFLFTDVIDKRGKDDWKCPVAHVVRLPQLSRDEDLIGGGGLLREDNIAQGLAERLQLTSHQTHLVHYQYGLNHGLYSKEMAVESSPLEYLAHTYARASREKVESSLTGLIQKCKDLIGEMTGRIALVHHQKPFSNTLSDLLIQTLSQTKQLPLEFFYCVADCVSSTSTQSLGMLFFPALERVFTDHLSAGSLSSPTLSLYFSIMDFFSCNASLAKLLVGCRCWSPPSSPPNGSSFEMTLLGKLVCPSPLALTAITPSEHFPMNHHLTQPQVEATTSSIHLQLSALMERTEKIFSKLLRVDVCVKRAVIKWLVDCFAANSTRAQMAYRYQSGMETMLLAGDGFFLNLNWLLLLLCRPFMVSGGEKGLARLSSVEPSYCSPWTQEQCTSGDSIGPLVDFSKETKLVPSGDDQASGNHSDSAMPNFQFVTHCFFLTHKSLILGMTQVVYRLEDRIRTYMRVQEAVRQMGFPNTNHTHPIVQQYLLLRSQVLGLRTHAMHPDLLNLALSFHASTAHWLVLSMGPLSLPHPHTVPSKLKDFPECLVDNMANFAMFLRHSDSETLALSSHLHGYFITFSTIFMGSGSLVHNPHIRAKLAQLVLLIAAVGASSHQPQGLLPSVRYSESQRQVFGNHSIATQRLLPALMTIFIDIEFTGESMEFEDKFQYRLPMYELLEFLWSIPSYRVCIDSLAREVCESLVLLETPLFLRFINMIINDATVQLDEGLENLAKVKQIEDVMSSEDWAGLSEQDKKDSQHRLAEARMMARNRNLLAQKTMEALSMITSDTWKPFVVESIVQRMANMLNYVLKLLVGARSRELKVKNTQQLNFKPDELVCAVVTVYVNLGKERNFCEALLKDGRSFSMELFAQARRVITVVNKPNSSSLNTELSMLEERVKQSQIELANEQEAYDNPPEEFLDPLTLEIMSDPVKLPNSGKIMDRANILRHLLSDQTDPFNRAPLTPDMLTPDRQLKDRIEQWKRQQRGLS